MKGIGPQWNDVAADVFREIGNIGASHAATALSVLLRGEVRVSVTSARIVPLAEVATSVGGEEQIVAGVFIRFSGFVRGSVLLVLQLPSAQQWVSQLLGREVTLLSMDELEQSTLAELGNMLSGAYLNSLAQWVGQQVRPEVPGVSVDMAGAILDTVLSPIGEVSNFVILIDTTIAQRDATLGCHLFLLPDPDSAELLLKALGA
ncbi:chemotaxis protein CheC [Alicyclobacillaceae bacterium I2511]|nr:chemotaxis protein CheC [Alicyclobacillaceae bacterium I2511]